MLHAAFLSSFALIGYSVFFCIRPFRSIYIQKYMHLAWQVLVLYDYSKYFG